MKKKRINRNLLFMIILLCVTIGYAYLNSELMINGTTEISGNTWDVHFENVVPSQNNTATVNVAPVANPVDKVTNLTYEITFNRPGDVYEFNVDIVNGGTIDAMIEELTSTVKIGNGEVQPLSNETLPSYLRYYVSYADGMKILNNHMLSANNTETITVHVEYKMDINQNELDNSSGKTITLSVLPTYTQADENAIERTVALDCTYNGTLYQGAQYNNGQYTYRYKQGSNGTSWYNISDDGWGVQLSNKDSSSPVTSKLCSTINGKPIVNMRDMFSGSYTTSIDTSSFNTSKVTDMTGMFWYCDQLEELDLSGFDTSNVKNMMMMFGNAVNLTELDLSSFDTSEVTNMSSMFEKLNISSLDLSGFNTSKVTEMSNIFSNISGLENLNISGWDFTKVSNGFHSYVYHSSIKNLDVSNVKFGASMDNAFDGLSNLETLNLSGVDTSKTTSMVRTFYGFKFSSVNLSDFDTQNVTNMSNMFNASKIERLDLSNWDTRNLTNMGYFCSACYELKYLNLNNWGNDNLSSIVDMTYGDSKLEEIHMKNFNFGHVFNLGSTQGPFYDKTNLKVVDLDGAKMTSIYWTIRAFQNCKELEVLDLSNIIAPTPIVQASTMFSGATKLTTLDLSGFDFSQLDNASVMFSGVPATTVYVKTQADVDMLNAKSDKPDTMTFVVKP